MSRLKQAGFTLIELMVVLTVLSILSTFALSSFVSFRQSAYLTKAKVEFKTMRAALMQYHNENDKYPPDVDRDVPPGIEEYLAFSNQTIDNWPNGPWPGSVYDYDAYTIDGVPVYQVSIRFCAIDGSNCKFPLYPWAKDFDVQSSVYFCIEGECKPHPNVAPTHPGYCINCDE